MKVYDIAWRKEGDKKKSSWEKVGILVIKDDGKISIKINSIPVGNWDGWLTVFKKEERRTQNDKEDSPF